MIQRIVEYMRDNGEMFAPFVEDDETFPSYLSRMKKDGYVEGHDTVHCLLT